MLSQRIRSMQVQTWLDDDPNAHRWLVMLFVGPLSIVIGLVIATMRPSTSVTITVASVFGGVGVALFLYGVHDLRDARSQYLRRRREAEIAEQQLHHQAEAAHLCATKEVCVPLLKRHPARAREIFGAEFVDRLPAMTSGG